MNVFFLSFSLITPYRRDTAHNVINMLKCCIIESWIMAFSTTTTTNSKTNSTNPSCSLISSHPIMSCISTIEHTLTKHTQEMCKTEQGGSSLENNDTVTISFKGFKEHKPVTDSYQKKHAEEQKKQTARERREHAVTRKHGSIASVLFVLILKSLSQYFSSSLQREQSYCRTDIHKAVWVLTLAEVIHLSLSNTLLTQCGEALRVCLCVLMGYGLQN